MKRILLISLIISSMGIAQTGGDYDIQKSVIASGGGNSNGGNFVVTGSIGQHDANTESTGGNYALSGGFWVEKTPIILTENIFANGFEN